MYKNNTVSSIVVTGPWSLEWVLHDHTSKYRSSDACKVLMPMHLTPHLSIQIYIKIVSTLTNKRRIQHRCSKNQTVLIGSTRHSAYCVNPVLIYIEMGWFCLAWRIKIDENTYNSPRSWSSWANVGRRPS